MSRPSDALLAEQLEYYRARAHEYDEWWERRGRYDRGPEATAAWHTEIAVVRSAFDALDLEGDIVELAPGTGYWTHVLVQRGATVTAIDGSAEMLDANRVRLGSRAGEVDHRQEDLFAWSPERTWDGVVFCFWISHVPVDRIPAFFATCARAVRRGGSMFFLDGQRTATSTSPDHTLPAAGEETMVRRLNDGREFRIVKNFYDPVFLVDAAADAGFDLAVEHTATYFQYGVGHRR